MNARNRLLAVVGTVALAMIGSTAVQAAGQTAKASLPQALASAKKWQADAVLVHLSSTKVQSDGSAAEWTYSFYAPKTQKRCVVRVQGGSVTLKEVRLGNFSEPLGEFIDSDKAMAAAKQNGLKGNEPSMSVMRPAGAKADSTTWIVTGGWKMGVDTTISLDARTGKFEHRTVMGADK